MKTEILNAIFNGATIKGNMEVKELFRYKLSDLWTSLKEDIIAVVNSNPIIFNAITPETDIIFGISCEEFSSIVILAPDMNGNYRIVIHS